MDKDKLEKRCIEFLREQEEEGVNVSILITAGEGLLGYNVKVKEGIHGDQAGALSLATLVNVYQNVEEFRMLIDALITSLLAMNETTAYDAVVRGRKGKIALKAMDKKK